MSTNPRYDGQPLLRLLDVYVLWAIGELSQESEEGLKRMAPKLQSLFGGDGQWHDAVAQSMHMPEGMPAAIRICGGGMSKSLASTARPSRPRDLPRCSWTRISEVERFPYPA